MIEFQEDDEKSDDNHYPNLYGIILEIISDGDEEEKRGVWSCTLIDIADDGNKDDC